MEPYLIAFDTETATARGAPHLIEIGAVRAVGGEVVDTFESLVRPQVEIDPEVTQIHGLRDADVRDAPDAREVLERFAAWAGADWLAAHNARFDAGVLAFEAARHGVALPRVPILDTLTLARRWIPESPDHRLGTLVQHLELDAGTLHRALADALACWQVLEECRVRQRAGAGAAGAADSARGADGSDAADGANGAPGDWRGPLLAGRGGALTFERAAPRTPPIGTRLRPLARACAEGLNVTLVYGEGDGALARLAVAPRLLFLSGQHAYLEGECLRSGVLKTYRLDRVRRVLP